jgi:hypothetical protein
MTLEQLTKDLTEVRTVVAGNTVRISEACARLYKAEQAIEEQQKMLVVMERLANGVNNLSQKVDEVVVKIDLFGTRVHDLEMKPAKRWEVVVTDFIKLLLAAGVGYLISQL